jgi:hypothetical protein
MMIALGRCVLGVLMRDLPPRPDGGGCLCEILNDSVCLRRMEPEGLCGSILYLLEPLVIFEIFFDTSVHSTGLRYSETHFSSTMVTSLKISSTMVTSLKIGKHHT